MPIKFRCEYCKQLIGIADSKAGSLVDCPTCARTLRVPNREGIVEAPPRPVVDFADDGLRRALDELAQIGQSEGNISPHDPRAASAAVAGSSAEVESPANSTGASAAMERQPNAPGNAIALEPLPSVKVIDPPRSPSGSASDTIETHADVLAELAAQPGASQSALVNLPAAPVNVPNGRPPRNYSLRALVCTCVLSLLIGMGSGFGLGRHWPATPNVPASLLSNKSQPAPQPAAHSPQVMGRLTFRDAQQRVRPDAGASVVVLPVTWQLEKLRASGFRPNDDEESFRVAATQLAEKGGRLARADEQGRFVMELPQGDEFTLIALSHFSGAAATEAAAHSHQIGTYFSRPDQLTGKLAVQVTTIKCSDSKPVVWDHTFGD